MNNANANKAHIKKVNIFGITSNSEINKVNKVNIIINALVVYKNKDLLNTFLDLLLFLINVVVLIELYVDLMEIQHMLFEYVILIILIGVVILIGVIH